MKSKITIGLFTLALVAIISACSTSNDVATNRLIQKRKYNKGFHIEKNTRHFGKDKLKQSAKDNVAKTETETETTPPVTQHHEEREIVSQTIPAPTANQEAEIENNTVSKTIEMPQKQNNNLTETAKAPLSVNDNRTSKLNVKKLPKRVRELKKVNKNAADSDVMLILMVILAIIIPPLAVFIYEGVTNRFWIDLILALIGWGLAAWLLGGTLGAIGGLAAIIYALLIILEVI